MFQTLTTRSAWTARCKFESGAPLQQEQSRYVSKIVGIRNMRCTLVFKKLRDFKNYPDAP